MANLETAVCKARTHCPTCRKDESWRASLLAAGLVKERDFECPHGLTGLTASTVQRDALIALATTTDQLQALAKGDMQKRGCCGQKELGTDIL